MLSTGPCAGRLPRGSRRTPELARSVLHTERGCQGKRWGGTDLPWMGAERTTVPSGANGLIEHPEVIAKILTHWPVHAYIPPAALAA